MSNDIRDILNRFKQVEEGLDANQTSVKQLPALFKPKDISPVLGSKTDPKNPMKGYFVGGESIDDDVEEDTSSFGHELDLDAKQLELDPVHPVAEDVISAVKKKLGDYLKTIEDEIRTDPDLKDKVNTNIDHVGPVVKTLTTDDGHEIKIHGNEDDGFRITIKNKPSKSKFENLDHAVMACEMFCNRRRQQPVETQDYVEEKNDYQ
jgi:hypothetical protein